MSRRSAAFRVPPAHEMKSWKLLMWTWLQIVQRKSTSSLHFMKLKAWRADLTHAIPAPRMESHDMKLNLPTIRYYMALHEMATDTDLARALGWSKSKLSRILSGKHEVKGMIVRELAKALDCKEAEIVELEDVAQTPFQRAVLSGIQDAEPNVQAAVRALLNIPDDIPSDG